jgi:predicted site-specific integrase-resolvase
MILTDVPPNSEAPEWTPLTKAAKNLGTSHAKLSRWVKQGRIKFKKTPHDERETLVDMVELRKIFNK